jgi:hypothetical protein
MTSAEIELTTALLRTGLVMPHKSYVKGGRAEILCRPVPGQDPQLLELLKNLLVKAEEAEIHLHVCKRFVAKEGALAYGWNFAIDTSSGKKLKEAIDVIKPLLEEARPDLQSMVQVQASQASPPQKIDVRAAARKAGVVVDSEAGFMGKLAPRNAGEDIKYEVGKRLPGASMSLVSVNVEGDSRTEIYEMPLPHVTRELNIPMKVNPATGKKEPHPDGAGASLYGKRSFGRRG